MRRSSSGRVENMEAKREGGECVFGWLDFYRLAMRVCKDAPERDRNQNIDNYPLPRESKPIVASMEILRRRPVRWHVCATGE